ncbi:MAG: Cof-type HAD-IIB family hydrolase [Treponema sp.]|nr:Cof-type HAD-IIB family hydrolase [Treponema sp.]
MKNIDITQIKALAIDLDGTALLPDSSMGERTIQCLKKLIANNIQIIFCTGRAIESSCRYYNAIGASGPMVFFNGAEVAEIPEVKIISSSLLNLKAVDFALDLARKTDSHFQVFLPPQEDGKKSWEQLFIDKQRPEAEMYRQHTGIRAIEADLKKVIAMPELKGAVKAMFIAEPKRIAVLRKKIIDCLGSSIYTAISFPSFLEIMSADASKGKGLRTVLQHRGLSPNEVIAIGDEENDLPMFAVAGYSAAPSSARENIRRAADFVFGSNAEEGLAAFLEKMF